MSFRKQESQEIFVRLTQKMKILAIVQCCTGFLLQQKLY